MKAVAAGVKDVATGAANATGQAAAKIADATQAVIPAVRQPVPAGQLPAGKHPINRRLPWNKIQPSQTFYRYRNFLTRSVTARAGPSTHASGSPDEAEKIFKSCATRRF